MISHKLLAIEFASAHFFIVGISKHLVLKLREKKKMNQIELLEGI